MAEAIRERLSLFRAVFFREKYRFDQGNAFLVFINFAMLVTSLVKQSHGSDSNIYIYVLVGLVGTWFLGFFLDKVVRVQDAQEKVALKRSPIWKENFCHHNSQRRKIRQLEQKLDNIERLAVAIKKNTEN